MSAAGLALLPPLALYLIAPALGAIAALGPVMVLLAGSLGPAIARRRLARALEPAPAWLTDGRSVRVGLIDSAHAQLICLGGPERGLVGVSRGLAACADAAERAALCARIDAAISAREGDRLARAAALADPLGTLARPGIAGSLANPWAELVRRAAGLASLRERVDASAPDPAALASLLRQAERLNDQARVGAPANVIGPGDHAAERAVRLDVLAGDRRHRHRGPNQLDDSPIIAGAHWEVTDELERPAEPAQPAPAEPAGADAPDEQAPSPIPTEPPALWTPAPEQQPEPADDPVPDAAEPDAGDLAGIAMDAAPADAAGIDMAAPDQHAADATTTPGDDTPPETHGIEPREPEVEEAPEGDDATESDDAPGAERPRRRRLFGRRGRGREERADEPVDAQDPDAAPARADRDDPDEGGEAEAAPAPRRRLFGRRRRHDDTPADGQSAPLEQPIVAPAHEPADEQPAVLDLEPLDDAEPIADAPPAPLDDEVDSWRAPGAPDAPAGPHQEPALAGVPMAPEPILAPVVVAPPAADEPSTADEPPVVEAEPLMLEVVSSLLGAEPEEAPAEVVPADEPPAESAPAPEAESFVASEAEPVPDEPVRPSRFRDPIGDLLRRRRRG